MSSIRSAGWTPSAEDICAAAVSALPAASVHAMKWSRLRHASRTTSLKVTSAALAIAIRSARPVGLSGSREASSSTARLARSIISFWSRSSSTAKRAGTLASNGNCCSSRVHSAWMVCTFNPPGVSNAQANSSRARLRKRASSRAIPASRIAASSAASSSVTQSPRVENTRSAILAAAALVKVMQRIFSGDTPLSNSRITRCTSTWVLPEPAFAETNADEAGSEARAWVARTASGIGRGTFTIPRSQAAGRGPFLDAGEIVVAAVAVRPHRQIERSIRFVLVLEFADQDFKLLSCVVGGRIGRLRLIARFDLQLQRSLFARRIIAAQPDIDEFADGRARIDPGKAALAQDRRLQRQLRRQAHADLLGGRRLSGFVVEDSKCSVMAALDPVGAGRQYEGAFIVETDGDFASDLGVDASDIAASRDFPFGEPCRDALEARPPQRPCLRPLHQGSEKLLADPAQGAGGIVGKRFS